MLYIGIACIWQDFDLAADCTEKQGDRHILAALAYAEADVAVFPDLSSVEVRADGGDAEGPFFMLSPLIVIGNQLFQNFSVFSHKT